MVLQQLFSDRFSRCPAMNSLASLCVQMSCLDFVHCGMLAVIASLVTVMKRLPTPSSCPVSLVTQLVVMIGVRKLLDFIFTQRELKVLDDVMPEHTKKKREEEEKMKEVEQEEFEMKVGCSPVVPISLASPVWCGSLGLHHWHLAVFLLL